MFVLIVSNSSNSLGGIEIYSIAMVTKFVCNNLMHIIHYCGKKDHFGLSGGRYVSDIVVFFRYILPNFDEFLNH